jgi:post-segregation antitoxin (ccd killing protein)
MGKTNITLRVDDELVAELRKREVNLSKFFNDAANILIFKKEAYLNVAENELEFV